MIKKIRVSLFKKDRQAELVEAGFVQYLRMASTSSA